MIAGTVFARHRQPQKWRKPVHLIVDECHTMLSKDINLILSEARKYGLHMTLCQQYLGQGMTPQMKNTVLTNTAVKILGGQARTNKEALIPHFHPLKEPMPKLKP